jgi:hypothetical protein
MESQKAALPNELEIAEFLERIQRDSSRQPTTIDPEDDGERRPERAEIVLDNTSRGSGVVLAIYGKLE